MLRASYASMLSDQDQLIFDTLVPADHYLRQVNALVDFERYRATMAACYHATDATTPDESPAQAASRALQIKARR
jgi:hypothetical protein